MGADSRQTLADIVLAGARDWPDSAAVILPGLTWSFADLQQEAAAVAQSLQRFGIRPGDHVALLLPNGADFVRSFFGVALAGGVAVTLNVRYRRADLSHVLDHCDAKALIITREQAQYVDFEKLLEGLWAEQPELRPAVVIVLDGARSVELMSGDAFFRHDANGPVHQTPASNDPAIMLYTSGTTALPKGVRLSHDALARSTHAWGQEVLGLAPGKSIWIPNPLFHIGALTCLIAAINAGATFLSMPYFQADAAVQMLSQNAVTTFFPVFDAIAMPIFEHADASRLRLDRMEYCCVTGNPKNVDRIKANLPGVRFLNTYGMTETSSWCCINFDDSEEFGPLPGGFPLPGVEVRIDDDANPGAEAPPGTVGRIKIRSYGTLLDYYKSPDATARSLDRDGWFDTGDLGVRRGDGSIRFTARADDMIKVGGENVSPMEIETTLAKHPAVRMVAVVAAPHDRLGYVPAAFVETYPGAALKGEELRAFCADNIARFKVPKHFRFLSSDDWPMSATKIRKTVLRDRLAAELAATDK